MSDVTRTLTGLEQGDRASAEELLPLVYHELRKLAAHKMAGQAPGHTLQPTALVHEAWLRLEMRNAIHRRSPRSYPLFFSWQSRTGLKLLAQRLRLAAP